MDPRCPRKLTTPPLQFCPMAIQHLRWREALGREPSEAEEQGAPGCQWAIRDHSNAFCFFAYIATEPEPASDLQIANALSLSEHTVRAVRERGIAKLADGELAYELKEAYGGDPIIVERLVNPYEDDLADYSNLRTSFDENTREPPEDKT